MTYDAFIMSGVAEHYASELHRLQLSLAQALRFRCWKMFGNNAAEQARRLPDFPGDLAVP